MLAFYGRKLNKVLSKVSFSLFLSPTEVFLNKTRHNVAIKLRNCEFYLPVHQSLNKNHFEKKIFIRILIFYFK